MKHHEKVPINIMRIQPLLCYLRYQSPYGEKNNGFSEQQRAFSHGFSGV
jgi:hypothetical protein